MGDYELHTFQAGGLGGKLAGDTAEFQIGGSKATFKYAWANVPRPRRVFLVVCGSAPDKYEQLAAACSEAWRTLEVLD